MVDAGAPGTADAGADVARPGGQLVDTPFGAPPVFDTDAVYLLAPRNQDYFMLGIPHIGSLPMPYMYSVAAADAPSDDIQGIVADLTTAFIDPVSRRLFYRSNEVHDFPLRQFVRDDVPGGPEAAAAPPDVKANDPVFDDGAGCDPTLELSRDYLVSLEGAIYHTCGSTGPVWMGDASIDPPVPWRDASGKVVFDGQVAIVSIGASGRALGRRPKGSGWDVVVVDGKTGNALGSADPSVGFPPSSKLHLSGVRRRGDGFWVVVQLSSDGGHTEAGTDLTWMDIDLSGTLRARGSFAPLPAGIHEQQNDDGPASQAPLDSLGRAYQYARDATDHVVVRRPMLGKSEILYHEKPGDPLAYWLLYAGGFVSAG